MKFKKQSFFLFILVLLMGILALFLLGLFLKQRNELEPSLLPKEENSFSNAKTTTTNSLELKKEVPSLKTKVEEKDEGYYLLTVDFLEEESLLAYQLELLFNPKIFRIKEIEKGTFFPSSLVLEKTIDNEKGRVIFSVGVLPEDQRKEDFIPKDSSLAIFHLYSQQKENKELYFGPKTILTSPGSYWENLNQVLPPIIFADNE